MSRYTVFNPVPAGHAPNFRGGGGEGCGGYGGEGGHAPPWAFPKSAGLFPAGKDPHESPARQFPKLKKSPPIPKVEMK